MEVAPETWGATVVADLAAHVRKALFRPANVLIFSLARLIWVGRYNVVAEANLDDFLLNFLYNCSTCIFTTCRMVGLVCS